MKKTFLLFLMGIFGFMAIQNAHAASLSVVANRSVVMIGQPFRVDIALNTQGDDANAIQGQLNFPASQFAIQNILDGQSPFSFWIQAPALTTSGTVSFSGIVPSGFEGAASSVISLWLMPLASGTGVVSLDNVQLLRNDGQGTLISLATRDASIIVTTAVASTTSIRPVSFVTPDPFMPIISHDPGIYNDQYFLAFSTTDEGSGVAYYQVLEVPVGSGASLTPDWQTATSPYLLKDQSLSSDIYVRAVDHDGNFIVVEVPATHSAMAQSVSRQTISLIFMLGFLLLIMIIVAWSLLK
jgi:hypothetical protein